jgi:proline iminopeptidase|tara:strand:- start:2772 stop:3740 length:969 start_codon:yes stop_codon:yes gene_type:complete
MPSNFQQNTLELFPEIETFNNFHLPNNNMHEVYVEESGNPEGVPIIFLHGGPGGGCGSKQRRFFDPSYYRIILFDQRGCGKSTPLGETQNNTTSDLINDMELIRQHLKIEDWFLFGGSWGSTLALAYAIEFPNTVKGLILRGIFLSRPHELEWFLNDVDQFFPDLHDNLLSHDATINKKNLVSQYSKLVFGDDQIIAKNAAVAWNQFEGSILKLMPPENIETSESVNFEFELARAKVQLHYIQNQCFVDGDEILKKVNILKDKPIAIIQGRYDMVCPPKTAYELMKHLPDCDFIMVANAGHSASEPGTLSALIGATEKFKSL